ncbi:hypothetical protein CDD83_10511 [Cordyceps sp. RAO-2017]|nr:hypothetical protein CDD83_10511 [Cordyceps sp. RAO-2017]
MRSAAELFFAWDPGLHVPFNKVGVFGAPVELPPKASPGLRPSPMASTVSATLLTKLPAPALPSFGRVVWLSSFGLAARQHHDGKPRPPRPQAGRGNRHGISKSSSMPSATRQNARRFCVLSWPPPSSAISPFMTRTRSYILYALLIL